MKVHLTHGKSTGTTIHLDGFEGRYLKYCRKTAESISSSILEHCLWYFLRPAGAPDVTMTDGDESIDLGEVFHDHMHTSAAREEVHFKGAQFDLVHAKLRSNSLSAHTIAFCADQRLVMEEKLSGKLPGLHGRISDDGGGFLYSCYVSSPFLDTRALPQRTGFDILDAVDSTEELLSNEVTMEDIRALVTSKAEGHLASYLQANIGKSKERVARFVATKAPRYRPILSRIPDEQMNIDPAISDKDLDLTLHKHFAALESELLAEGHDIVSASSNEDFEGYHARLQE